MDAQTSTDAIISKSVNATSSIVDVMKSASVQNYSCLSSFVLMFLDYLYTFPDEIVYIWGQSMSTTKFSFLFLRYYGMLSQIATCLVAMARLYHVPASSDFCKGWFALQMFSYWAIFSVSDIVLMWRVYDLYERSRVITGILMSLFMLETIVTAVVTTLALAALQFDPVCNGTDIPVAVVVFACTVIFCRCIVWSLTLWKSDCWFSQKAIIDAFTSNGTWFWIAISAMLAVTIPSCYGRQIALPHILFSWPMSLHSIGTSRLLLSQEKRRYHLFQEFMKNERAKISQDTVVPSVLEAPCVNIEVTSSNTESTCHQEPDPAIPALPDKPEQKTVTPPPSFLPPQPEDEQFDDKVEFWSSSNATTVSEGESGRDDFAHIEVGSMHFRTSMSSSDGRDLWYR